MNAVDDEYRAERKLVEQDGLTDHHVVRQGRRRRIHVVGAFSSIRGRQLCSSEL